MIVRLIRLTFPDGSEMVGLMPAALGDGVLLANTEGGVSITFSELARVPSQVPISKVMERIRAATMGPLH